MLAGGHQNLSLGGCQFPNRRTQRRRGGGKTVSGGGVQVVRKRPGARASASALRRRAAEAPQRGGSQCGPSRHGSPQDCRPDMRLPVGCSAANGNRATHRIDVGPRVAGLKDRPDSSPGLRRRVREADERPERSTSRRCPGFRERGASHEFGPLGGAPRTRRRFASTGAGRPTERRFDECFLAANPDQRRDSGPLGLSPVESLVATLIRAMIGSVFQTCNSRRDARRREAR